MLLHRQEVTNAGRIAPANECRIADGALDCVADRLPRFPLVKLHSVWLREGQSASFDGITASARIERDGREVVVAGPAKGGKRWEATMASIEQVWRGDLDRNGMPDYVFLSLAANTNGRTAAPLRLRVLMMDANGIPWPFAAPVYPNPDASGVNRITDLDGDGRAEVLISVYDENHSDPLAPVFCSGHSTTRAYRLGASSSGEFTGEAGGIRFPFVHRWSNRDACGILEEPRRWSAH